MNDIAHKAIVLKLNRNWQPVGVGLVWKTICDMMTGVVKGLNIIYEENKNGTPNFNVQPYAEPVTWDKWITLPVRDWDIPIHSAKMTIRVPTVVVSANYAKVPEKKFRGKPTKEALAIRDNLTDAYSGLELDYNEATIDHVLPKARGGEDTYENTVLTTKETNNRKGHKLNSEAGLTLFIKPHQPSPMKVSHTIRKPRHRDWAPFLAKHK